MSDDDLRRALSELADEWETWAETEKDRAASKSGDRRHPHEVNVAFYETHARRLRSVLAAYPVASPAGQDEGAAAERCIESIDQAFRATFIPDFAGFDWTGDKAIQDFAREVGNLLHRHLVSRPAPAVDEEATER